MKIPVALIGLGALAFLLMKKSTPINGGPDDPSPIDPDNTIWPIQYSNATAWPGGQHYITNYCAVYYNVTAFNPNTVNITKTYTLWRKYTSGPNNAIGERPKTGEEKRMSFVTDPIERSVVIPAGGSVEIQLPYPVEYPNTKWPIGFMPKQTLIPGQYGGDGQASFIIDVVSDYYLKDQDGNETPHINLPL